MYEGFPSFYGGRAEAGERGDLPRNVMDFQVKGEGKERNFTLDLRVVSLHKIQGFEEVRRTSITPPSSIPKRK